MRVVDRGGPVILLQQARLADARLRAENDILVLRPVDPGGHVLAEQRLGVSVSGAYSARWEARMSTTSDVQTADPSSDALDVQIERANGSGRTPVLFVHGLWLLPSSWQRWVVMFEEAGYPAVTPGWPDD